MKNLIKISILVLIFCLLNIKSEACINITSQPQVGKPLPINGLSADEFMKRFITHEDRVYWEIQKTEVEKNLKKYFSRDGRNDLAATLIHLGKISEAIKILEQLEKEKPGIYYTATNLGTAYELNGENQKALNWINEGIKRNKDSHFGTEWLHVKILEAKLAIEKDANWLKNNSVLGLDFTDTKGVNPDKNFVIDKNGQELTLAKIEEAMVYQLHERLEFVKPPDATVADLLSDLGNVFVYTKTPEHAKITNELSVKYGANPQIISRYDKSDNKEKVSISQPSNIFYLLAAMVAILLIGAVYIFFRKRKNQTV